MCSNISQFLFGHAKANDDWLPLLYADFHFIDELHSVFLSGHVFFRSIKRNLQVRMIGR
ncbi:hypothetical protein JN06_00814 [Bacteroides zoogleoformans]|nr:hypothetical protein JN06_00814 [Bacteroides zoogleoformans]